MQKLRRKPNRPRHRHRKFRRHPNPSRYRKKLRSKSRPKRKQHRYRKKSSKARLKLRPKRRYRKPKFRQRPTPEENPDVETTNNETENTTTETEIVPENTTTEETSPENETRIVDETQPPPEPQTTPTPTPTGTPAENNQSQISEVKTENTATVAKNEPPSKPFFEPIVINVRNKEGQKPKTTESEQKTENVSAETEKSESKNTDTISTRPRVIIEDKFKTEETPKCELVASQESVWLVNGGGSLGILVGFAGQGEAEKITAVSSSPADVEVSLEPEIGANSGRAFFILKSISPKKGAFTVTFNSPCGKKEVQVRVR